MEVKESGDEGRRAGAFSVIYIAGWGEGRVSQVETKHRFKILYKNELKILGKDQS